MKIIFHPEAYEEMLESARYFETKTPGLGFDFLSAIQDSKDRQVSRVRLDRARKNSQVSCSWFSIHNSLRSSTERNIHRGGDAPASQARVLAGAHKVKRFWARRRVESIPQAWNNYVYKEWTMT